MIYVNGDSWSQPTPFVGNEDIWPTLVANRINLKLENRAIGCGNNFRIADDLENLYLENHQPEYIIIGLTTHARDYISAAEMSHWNIGQGFARLENTGEYNQEIRKWWATYSYDTVESVYRYYKNLLRLHELCSKFDCPYLMFQVWDHELAELDLLGGEEKVAKFLEKYYPNENAWFRTRYAQAFKTLTKFSNNWNYIERSIKLTADEMDEYPIGHPNHQGHARLADFVYQHIQKV